MIQFGRNMGKEMDDDENAFFLHEYSSCLVVVVCILSEFPFNFQPPPPSSLNQQAKPASPVTKRRKFLR
jgi:hypothetical protein